MKEGPAYSLEELAAETERALGRIGPAGAADGRVSAFPDTRTVRYYTTLGLLDRPRIEGRQAVYGRRHLLQLVAVKALQSRGLALAQVQARLLGLADDELEALASAAAAPERPRRDLLPGTHRVATWREVTVVPGLRLLAADGFAPPSDPRSLRTAFEAALSRLSTTTDAPAAPVHPRSRRRSR